MSEIINTSSCPSALQKAQIEKQELLNKIEAAEFHTTHYLEQLQDCKIKYEKLQQENKIMREALESIACATLDFSDLHDDYYGLKEVIINDTIIAREALEKVSK